MVVSLVDSYVVERTNLGCWKKLSCARSQFNGMFPFFIGFVRGVVVLISTRSFRAKFTTTTMGHALLVAFERSTQGLNKSFRRWANNDQNSSK